MPDALLGVLAVLALLDAWRIVKIKIFPFLAKKNRLSRSEPLTSGF
jgi:hypothetical protein